MQDRTKIRVGKRIMAVMLSLAMVFGIFSGMKLDARAAKSMEIDLNNYAISGHEAWIHYDNITYEDEIIFKLPTYSQVFMTVFSNQSELHGSPYTYLFKDILKKDKSYKLGVKITVNSSIDIYKVYLYFDENKPQEIANAFEEKTDTSHICNFEWITSIDPTIGADGLEEYKCVYCGAVQESHPIPAGVAAVKDFYGKVKDAPENGTVTYDSGKLYTISDYLLKKMSERNDVTLTVNFEYQNAKYELTFPAGTDFTPVLTDEETMYGYFGVAAKLGLTVAAK